MCCLIYCLGLVVGNGVLGGNEVLYKMAVWEINEAAECAIVIEEKR